MNISNYYWYFQGVIPPRICDMIVQYGKSEKKREIMAITGGYGRDRNLKEQPLSKEEIKDLQKKRDSNIVWMNDPWIYKEIQPYVHQANKNADWNFEWDHSESCQFTIYKKGQYYDWHSDSWDKPYMEEGPTKGKIRKLSVTVSLTDPKEYKGGELEFDFRNQDPDKEPALSLHRNITKRLFGCISIFCMAYFKPVTKGVRHSLVIWNLGYPFK